MIFSHVSTVCPSEWPFVWESLRQKGKRFDKSQSNGFKADLPLHCAEATKLLILIGQKTQNGFLLMRILTLANFNLDLSCCQENGAKFNLCQPGHEKTRLKHFTVDWCSLKRLACLFSTFGPFLDFDTLSWHVVSPYYQHNFSKICPCIEEFS